MTNAPRPARDSVARQELETLQKWVKLIASAVALLAFLFLVYVAFVGLQALRLNTGTLREVSQLAIGNRDMLQAIHEDQRTNRLRFDLILERLKLIETLNDQRQRRKP